MHILINGSSSFTGLYFLRDLLAKDFRVTIISSFTEYSLREKISPIVSFDNIDFTVLTYSEFFLKYNSDDSFMFQFSAICCHGFQVQDYTSPNYSILSSVADSLNWLSTIPSTIRYSLRIPIIYTGTYFENHLSINGHFPYTPYSESKSLSFDILSSLFPHCQVLSYRLPNPFGPLQQNKLAFSVISTWLSRKPFMLRNPHAIRDNIPIDFLSDHYASYIYDCIYNPSSNFLYSPSYYVESSFHFLCRLKFHFSSFFPNSDPRFISSNDSNDHTCLYGFDSLISLYSSREDEFWSRYLLSFIS